MTRTKHNLAADLFLDPVQRDIAPRVGQIGFSRAPVMSKGIDADKRQIHFLCSDDSLDLYGEVVAHGAMAESLADFARNPILPVQHQYASATGTATIVGSWLKVWYTKAGLEGIAQFATTPLAEEYWQLYRDGHMRAVSIGFQALAHEFRDLEIGGVMRRTRVHLKARLLEISLVSLPANPNALVRAGDNQLEMLAPLVKSAVLDVIRELQLGPVSSTHDDESGFDVRSYLADDLEEFNAGAHLQDDTADPDASSTAGNKELNDMLRAMLA